MRCAVTEDLNRQQGIWDQEAAREIWEEQQWSAFWDEIAQAEKAGHLSSWAVEILTKAVEDHGVMPEPEQDL
jgi:hypothetical protein